MHKKASNITPYYPTYNELITSQTVFSEEIDKNPYNKSNLIRNSKDAWDENNPGIIFVDCIPHSAPNVCGWNYDETSGKFWANTNTIGENLY